MGRAGAQGPGGTRSSLEPASLGFQDNLREGRGGTGPLSLDSDLTKQRLEASPELTLSSNQHCPENMPGVARSEAQAMFGVAALAQASAARPFSPPLTPAYHCHMPSPETHRHSHHLS